jgi:hypothetical protein
VRASDKSQNHTPRLAVPLELHKPKLVHEPGFAGAADAEHGHQTSPAGKTFVQALKLLGAAYKVRA